ncbi:clotting factor C-like [Branchiostoma floridae x Branchiostoma belcheri]
MTGSNSYGDVVNFTCEPGYKLAGTSSLTCLSDGTWNGKSPTCTAVQCPTLPHPRNGFVTGFNSYGDVLHFTCDQGYRLAGKSSLTCLSDGSWSEQSPKCAGTECPAGSWTDWVDRDDPTGTADSEILTDLRQDYPGQICDTPTAVHARVISTQQEASLTGQHISSYDTTAGFLCRNVDQPDGICMDYEVRFCCSDVGKGGWLAQDSSWFLESIGRPHVKDGVTYDATKALDGDTTTYWNPTGTDQSFNNWYIILDLKSSHTLTRIAVNNYGDTTHDIAAFKLQASHVRCPRTWKDVVTITNVQGGARQRQEFGGLQGTSRYWRFVVTRTHSGWQPYLTELNFYGIPSGCKAGYTPVVGTCIRLSVRKTSYDVAREVCMNDGGTLAMPKTRGLDVALRSLIKTVGLKQDYWIGMKNAGYKHWQWEDGRALGNYQAWCPGEPDNQGWLHAAKLCVQYWAADNGNPMWDDVDCQDKNRYICQTSPT